VPDLALPLPKRAGIGLKPNYFKEIIATQPDIGFFEIHAENYMVAGGPFHHYLGLIRERYPLTLHGVGLSIGGAEDLDVKHLDRLLSLIDRYQPSFFSEHLAWSRHAGIYFNDLLPVSYSDETLHRVCKHIDCVQEHLKLKILIENPATYLEFQDSCYEEGDFLNEIVKRTGCGLLLDINNLYVSSVNQGRDPFKVIETMTLRSVCQMHLAGHVIDPIDSSECLLIDNHGTPVIDPVWQLYELALEKLGQIPTLLERDHDLPSFSDLMQEAQKAEHLMGAGQISTLTMSASS